MFTPRTLVLLFVSIFAVILYNTYQPKQDFPSPNHNSNEDMLTESGAHGKSEKHARGDFGKKWFPRSHFSGVPGGLVKGWPAKGGYYTVHCSLAELDFLGLDHFKPTNKSGDAQEEEAWCNRLRQLGARWCRDSYEELLDGQEGTEIPDLYVAWPADGGVWALQVTRFHSNLRGLGRIDNALTMEGRWQKIKEFGGTFFPDPKDCPYLDLDGSKESGKEG